MFPPAMTVMTNIGTSAKNLEIYKNDVIEKLEATDKYNITRNPYILFLGFPV